MKLTIDFETRSPVNLLKSDPWVYSEHPDADVLCLAVKEQGSPAYLWAPEHFRKFYTGLPLIDSDQVMELINKADEIEAHNVGFELAVWANVMVKKYKFAPLPIQKMRDSAAVAAFYALPRSLGQLAQVLKVSEQKDTRGKYLIQRLCKPRKPRKAEREDNPNWENTLYWNEDPELINELGRYCLQDVATEEAVSYAMPPLTDKELKLWKMDLEANLKGVRIDTNLVATMSKIHQAKQAEIAKEFIDLTGITPSQVTALAKWVSDKGVPTTTVDAQFIDKILSARTAPPEVLKALSLRRSYSKTSLKKLDAVPRLTGSDGRMRFNLMYCGAATHRWTGAGMQLQNLPSRGLVADMEQVVAAIQRGANYEMLDFLFGDALEALVAALRGVIVADEGTEFLVADYSSIEGRVLAWIAKEEHILQGYREGRDMYKVAAMPVFNKAYEDITKEERTIGKVPELAGGYGGGWRAYMKFAEGFRLEPPEDIISSLCEIDMEDQGRRLSKREAAYRKWFLPVVTAWRANRSNTVELWYGIERAAINAMKEPGKWFECNGVWFKRGPKTLQCGLPSKTSIYYFDPSLLAEGGKIGLSYMRVNSQTRRWERVRSYGGKLVENIVQATARDLMADAIARLWEKGYKMQFTVHDEIICQGGEGRTLDEMVHIMTQTPDWAHGLPIGADGWAGPRYKKD